MANSKPIYLYSSLSCRFAAPRDHDNGDFRDRDAEDAEKTPRPGVEVLCALRISFVYFVPACSLPAACLQQAGRQVFRGENMEIILSRYLRE